MGENLPQVFGVFQIPKMFELPPSIDDMVERLQIKIGLFRGVLGIIPNYIGIINKPL